MSIDELYYVLFTFAFGILEPRVVTFSIFVWLILILGGVNGWWFLPDRWVGFIK